MNRHLLFTIAALSLFLGACSDPNNDHEQNRCLSFVDQAVETYSLLTWDTNKNNCLEQDEVAQITTIPDNAFSGNQSIQSLDDFSHFPNLRTIGRGAFANCPNLTNASLNQITSIGDSAFAYCSSLTTVSFPNVSAIGQDTFTGCTSLTTINLPSQLQVEIKQCVNNTYRCSDSGNEQLICLQNRWAVAQHCENGCQNNACNSNVPPVTCPQTCTNGCDENGNCKTNTQVTCPQTCTNGCDKNGNCLSDVVTEDTYCPMGYDPYGKCLRTEYLGTCGADNLRFNVYHEYRDGAFESYSEELCLPACTEDAVGQFMNRSHCTDDSSIIANAEYVCTKLNDRYVYYPINEKYYYCKKNTTCANDTCEYCKYGFDLNGNCVSPDTDGYYPCTNPPDDPKMFTSESGKVRLCSIKPDRSEAYSYMIESCNAGEVGNTHYGYSCYYYDNYSFERPNPGDGICTKFVLNNSNVYYSIPEKSNETIGLSKYRCGYYFNYTMCEEDECIIRDHRIFYINTASTLEKDYCESLGNRIFISSPASIVGNANLYADSLCLEKCTAEEVGKSKPSCIHDIVPTVPEYIDLATEVTCTKIGSVYVNIPTGRYDYPCELGCNADNTGCNPNCSEETAGQSYSYCRHLKDKYNLRTKGTIFTGTCIRVDDSHYKMETNRNDCTHGCEYTSENSATCKSCPTCSCPLNCKLGCDEYGKCKSCPQECVGGCYENGECICPYSCQLGCIHNGKTYDCRNTCESCPGGCNATHTACACMDPEVCEYGCSNDMQCFTPDISSCVCICQMGSMVCNEDYCPADDSMCF